MPFLVKDTLVQMQTYLARSGYVDEVLVGEPKSPPSSQGLTAALFLSNVGIGQITAGGQTVESHVVMLRIYRNMLKEPTEQIEYELAEAVSNISDDLLGDFDLGARIRHIDAGGIYGTPFTVRWGYVEVSGTMFRIADITVPLVVDGSATLVQ